MKKNKSTALLILLVALLFTITGCGAKTNTNTASTESPTSTTEQDATKQETNETTSKSFTVEDMAGNKVEFDQVPEKMVVLLASDVEILYSLGAQDSITAVGEYCNYPSEALDKDKITTGDDLNLEQIIAQQPDVLIMGEMGQTTDQIKQLEDAGIKVVITNSQNIADTYKAIELLGQVSGKNDEATTLVESMKSEFQALKDKVSEKNSNKSTVYFEVSPLEYGLWTAGQNTFMQEIADIVGVKNLFDDVTGWAEISEEQVLERNPDYIVTVTMYSKDKMTPIEEILSRKNWTDVTAVKNKNVLSDDTDMFTRPGPRLVDAAKALYKLVYGE